MTDSNAEIKAFYAYTVSTSSWETLNDMPTKARGVAVAYLADSM